MDRQAAIKIYNSKWWEKANNIDRVKRQLFTPELIMPFGLFHESCEQLLGRPIRTEEFGFPDNLRKEIEKVLEEYKDENE